MDEENVIEMMGERWKKIRGYENEYLISESGKIYSLRRKKILKTPPIRSRKTTQPHSIVCLCKNGIQKVYYVHTLVIRHFVSEKPFDGAECRHLDSNSLNNHYTNLAWGTRQENTNDRLGNKKDPVVCFDKQLVINIKNDLLSGMKQADIAKKYNILIGTIQAIASNRSWKNIGPNLENFNYQEKQEEMKQQIDLNQLFADYLNHDINYVSKKYNINKYKVRDLLRIHGVYKTQSRQNKLKTYEELKPMFDDYFIHDVEYLVDKYKISRTNIYRYLNQFQIPKKKFAKKIKQVNSNDS